MTVLSRNAILLSALLPLASLAACGTEGAAGGASFTVRDSAGMEIVENTAPIWAAGDAWTLTAQPTLDIGVVDGAPEYELSGVSDAVRLANGGFAVANGGSEIRYYNGSGAFLRSVGRKGSGPGEFRGMNRIEALAGDSVLAYDGILRRSTVFGPEDTIVDSRTFPRPPSGDLLINGRFPDGTLLVVATDIFRVGDLHSGLNSDSIWLFHYSADGSRINKIVGLRGVERYLSPGEDMRMASPFFATSPEYTLGGNRVFAGDNDAYEIAVYDADGSPLELIRRDGAVRSVTQSDIDAERQHRLDRATNGPTLSIPAPSQSGGGSGASNGVMDASPAQQRMRALMDEMPVPATMPAFGGLLADQLGDLWVRAYVVPAAADAPSQWTVFDPDGHMLGDVTMPARFEPKQIGADFVLGVWKDDVDVEHVRMYGLEKPA